MISTVSQAYLADHIFEQSLDLICTLNREGRFTYMNNASERILGYAPEAMISRFYTDFVHPVDRGITNNTKDNIISGKSTTTFQNRYISKCGKEITISWSSVWSEDIDSLISIGRDITEQVQAKNKVREKEDLYQALIEHGSDMLALVDEEGNFKYISESHYKVLGYEQSQLIGLNAFSLVHPEDFQKAVAALEEILKEGGHVRLSAFRFKNAAGEWRWLETIGSNQLQNPNIKSVVLSSRDVTEPIVNKLKLKESEQRFKALFENNPDMVFFESTDGTILDVNPAALAFFGADKSELLGQKITSSLPPDAAAICNQQRQSALSGKRAAFELEVTVPGSGHLEPFILDISKIPVEINGAIAGLYVIARDITAIRNSQTTINRQAKKLNNIFESITDAFFTIDLDWNFTYLNSECERLLDINREGSIGRNILEVFPEERDSIFHKSYQHALTTGNSVSFEARLERNGKWLEVRAFPYNEGLSVYFADITNRVRAEQELEKLSLVASQTTNGVLLTNPDFIIEWVNEGFTKLTGYTFKEAVGKRPIELLGHEQTDYNQINLIRDKMNKGEPVAFEILNRSKEDQDIWLSVEENPIFGQDGEITGFVSTQTDITALKKSELELTQLTKDLYRHNSDMQQFTYIVSHNLRSPVANIIGLTQLLRKVDKDSDAFNKSLESLKKSASQLDSVLKDMNTILSIKDVKDTFDQEEVELNQVLQQVMASLQDPLVKCGGNLVVAIPGQCTVSGNKAYLHSIFHNLLSNSIKYKSPDRPLLVTVSCSSNSAGETVVSFSDNGSGFDMEKAGNKLFKLYSRFHTGRAEGRGIGLFLVKTHIEALGGRIEVQSEVNQGTTFTIYVK